MKRRTLLQSAVASAALSLALPGSLAWAQDAWPSKPINYIVPFPAGGTTDILARLIGQKLGPVLGTTLVIENRGGAGGSVGSEIAARAAPDGYTLLGGTISSHAINVSLYPKLAYDPIKSFSPVLLIGSNPVVLIVKADSPYKTLQDILQAAKAKPKSISSASAGNGTSQHMTLELLAFKSGTQFSHVPYKGSGPAIQDVIGGQVDMMFDTTVVAGPHIQSGKVRAIAVSSAKRLESLPNVPTIAESGVPGFDATAWFGVLAPAGTPQTIVNQLADVIQKSVKTPAVTETLLKAGAEPVGSTPAEFDAFYKAEVQKWAKVVKSANVQVE